MSYWGLLSISGKEQHQISSVSVTWLTASLLSSLKPNNAGQYSNTAYSTPNNTGQTAKSYQGKIATADWDFLERCCQGKTKAKAGQLNTYQLPRPPILLPLDWRAFLFERSTDLSRSSIPNAGGDEALSGNLKQCGRVREYPQQRWAAQDLHNRRKHRLSRRYGIPEFATCESGWAGAQQTEREETRARHRHSFPSFLFFNCSANNSTTVYSHELLPDARRAFPFLTYHT